MKFGLKLYSTDISLIPGARELQEKGFYDYVELYIIPGSYRNTSERWKCFNVQFIVHAPHSFHGINFAQTDKREENLQNFNEARLFADEFGLDSIIVHSGNNGSFEEIIRQLGLLQAYNDVFAIIKEVLVKGNLKAWLKTYPLVPLFKIR